MRTLTSLLMLTSMLSGCMTAGSNTVPHQDSVAMAPRDSGPTLCRDGSLPPCTIRD